MSDISATYRARRATVAARLAAKGIAAARFEDFEGMRSPSVRYLCGQPGDAFLLIGADGRCVLVAWDVNMAASHASVDEILDYTSFGRRSGPAMKEALARIGVEPGSRIELPRATSYPSYIAHVEALDEYDLVCESDGIDEFVLRMRADKDAAELALYRRACALTDSLIDRIEKGVRSGALADELDVGMFIEREARAAGAEGTGFETIAAGPSRSFAIHAFPSFGAGPFGATGMSILDFGIKVDGYTTDVTMSFVRGPLEPEQERMVALVEKAHRIAFEACAPGVRARDVALAVDHFFAENGVSMPHALGHGIGLEAHEAPGVNLREENDSVLKTGNIVTIEPGLYHPVLGGVRLEDDVLITENGREMLTSSRIVRL